MRSGGYDWRLRTQRTTPRLITCPVPGNLIPSARVHTYHRPEDLVGCFTGGLGGGGVGTTVIIWEKNRQRDSHKRFWVFVTKAMLCFKGT